MGFSFINNHFIGKKWLLYHLTNLSRLLEMKSSHTGQCFSPRPLRDRMLAPSSLTSDPPVVVVMLDQLLDQQLLLQPMSQKRRRRMTNQRMSIWVVSSVMRTTTDLNAANSIIYPFPHSM